MQKPLKKVRFWCVAACIVIVLGSSLAAAISTGKREDVRPPLRESNRSQDEWVSIEDGKEYPIDTFPYEVQGSKGIFCCQIPRTVTAEDVLVFFNHYQRVSVSIEGKEIYSYGMGKDDTHFIPANLKCFVEMQPEYQGKKLEVKTAGWQNRSMVVMDQPTWSTGSAIVTDILKQNRLASLFCIIAGIGGCILLTAAAILAVKRPEKGFVQPGETFVSLGIFMLISSLWILTDTELLQLCTGNSQLILIISFEAFFLLPVPFLWFMDQISMHKTRVFGWLRYAFVLNCIIQNVLYLTGIKDFMHMVLFTHLLIFVSIIYIVYFMIREYSHYQLLYAKEILVGIAVFMFLSGVSILFFYGSRGNGHERFFIIGFTLLVLDLLWVSLRKLREFTESGVKEKIYRELAFRDILTGLGNRNLFEKNMGKYESKEICDRFSVAVMDINGLKGVNDTFGHSEGDRLIRDGAECIRKTFSDMGECFRIGGDEFVVLMPDREADPAFCRKRMKEQLAEYNKGRQTPLSIAVGFAVKKAGTPENGNIAELIKKADADMYREKKADL